jgi:uncharacterized protein YndB with AHSA1/START domain
MSTKTKASSKKAKAPVKKATKKVIAKKPAVKLSTKKTTKPIKKAVVKKATPVKKVVVKKAAVKKKIVTKPAKKVIVKKAAVKKVVSNKKTQKPTKKAVVKKAITKKTLVKNTVFVKKVTPAKPVIEKVIKVKAEKPVKVKKEKAPIVKKPIVAPTTFRNAETTNPTSTKVLKEPAGKFEMEFVIRASEDMVFEFVSTESGLSEWFCDDVNIRDGVFTFNWDGQIQQAKLIKEVPPISIRYQWLDKNDGSYFEFRTQKDELTNDISLIITDFATDKADEISARLLWASQVDKLLHVLGSFF